VKGYLVDVNHVQAHFEKNAAFMSRIRKCPPHDLMQLSAVTFGEIHAGHGMTLTSNRQRRLDFDKFVIEEYLHLVVDITASTRLYYGSLMGRIWSKHTPSRSRIGTDAHLVSLGVNLNDVWLVANAWEHGLIVLTHDKMSCIREASPEVVFDCWI